MTFNITNVTAINSVFKLGEFATKSSNGIFWNIILFVLFIIIITRTRQYNAENGVIAACFACFIISILLVYLEFVTIITPILFALMFAGTAFYKRFKPE